MPTLDHYFAEDVEAGEDHPLIRHLGQLAARADFLEARAEVVRAKAPLGYHPAKLYVHFHRKSGEEIERPSREEWDDELNAALIQHQVKAIDVDNEKLRFALGLGAALESAEVRYGDGYYNTSLLHHLDNCSLKDHPAIAAVLAQLRRYDRIDSPSRSYAECQAMIDGAIRGRAQELSKKLGYPRTAAEDILAAAIASYLDDRFSVSSRRELGWL